MLHVNEVFGAYLTLRFRWVSRRCHIRIRRCCDPLSSWEPASLQWSVKSSLLCLRGNVKVCGSRHSEMEQTRCRCGQTKSGSVSRSYRS